MCLFLVPFLLLISTFLLGWMWKIASLQILGSRYKSPMGYGLWILAACKKCTIVKGNTIIMMEKYNPVFGWAVLAHCLCTHIKSNVYSTKYSVCPYSFCPIPHFFVIHRRWIGIPYNSTLWRKTNWTKLVIGVRLWPQPCCKDIYSTCSFFPWW